MSVFVSDSFSDSDGTLLENHTGETGASWTAHTNPANNKIVSNRLRGNGVTASVHYASGTPASADYEVEAEFYQASADEVMSILARLETGAVTYYGLQRRTAGGGDWRLVKSVAGTITSLGTYSDAMSNGDTRTAKITVTGDQIEAFIAGVSRIGPVTDTAITAAGRVGVRATGGSDSTGYHLNSLTATEADGGGGGPSAPIAAHHFRQMAAE